MWLLQVHNEGNPVDKQGELLNNLLKRQFYLPPFCQFQNLAKCLIHPTFSSSKRMLRKKLPAMDSLMAELAFLLTSSDITP